MNNIYGSRQSGCKNPIIHNNGNDRELARLPECVGSKTICRIFSAAILPLNMDGWRNSLDIKNENLRICNHATIMPHISLSGRMHQRLKPLGCKYLLGISHQIEQSRRPHILKRLVAQTP